MKKWRWNISLMNCYLSLVDEESKNASRLFRTSSGFTELVDSVGLSTKHSILMFSARSSSESILLVLALGTMRGGWFDLKLNSIARCISSSASLVVDAVESDFVRSTNWVTLAFNRGGFESDGHSGNSPFTMNIKYPSFCIVFKYSAKYNGLMYSGLLLIEFKLKKPILSVDWSIIRNFRMQNQWFSMCKMNALALDGFAPISFAYSSVLLSGTSSRFHSSNALLMTWTEKYPVSSMLPEGCSKNRL